MILIKNCPKSNEVKKPTTPAAGIINPTRILTSFASGDLIKLKALLSPKMFSNFSDAIKLRNKENIKSEFTFIGVKESSVEKYEKVKDN